MDWGQFIGIVASVLCSAVVGLISASIKKSVNRMEEDIKKNAADHQELRKEFNEFKADLPFIYVLREDYVRTMNSVEKKLDRILAQKEQGGNSNG